MADDVRSLAFDPNAMGSQTSFQPPAQPQAPAAPGGVNVTLDPNISGDSNWQRILTAAKQGLVSDAQLDAYAKKMGYSKQGQPQPGQQQQPQNIGGQLGQVAGDIAGRVGRAAYNGIQTANKSDDQVMADSQNQKMYMPPPSPGWNQ